MARQFRTVGDKTAMAVTKNIKPYRFALSDMTKFLPGATKPEL